MDVPTSFPPKALAGPPYGFPQKAIIGRRTDGFLNDWLKGAPPRDFLKRVLVRIPKGTLLNSSRGDSYLKISLKAFTHPSTGPL